MPNLDTLDTVIAMVVVLLVLSLVVQSIQTFVKKLLKLKSHSIQASLEDLFQHVLGVDAVTEASGAGGGGANVSPLAGGGGGNVTPPAGGEGGGAAPPSGEANVAATVPVKATQSDVQKLLEQVNKQFAALGRVTLTGRVMLDSLAKNDLLKVLTKVGADRLTPDAVKRFQDLLTQVQELKGVLDDIDENHAKLFAGEASAKFAAMRDTLAPLINDLEAVLGGNTKPATVIFGDLAKLRQIKVADVLSLLGEVQERVEQDRAEAQKAGETEKAAGLEKVAGLLRDIAAKVAALGQAFDRAFGQLRAKLEEVETWYDTVMQGFEERYTRHMRTVTFVIGAFVVVILNANFFTLYHNLSTDPGLRARVVAQGEAIDARLNEDAKKKAEAAVTTTPTAGTTPAPGASPTASPTPDKEVETAVREFRAELNDFKNTTDTFGLRPITWQETKKWLSSLWNDSGQVWRDARKHDFKVLLGWAIMSMLLSVGAPFWQDTLESLFGVKNLLRKKSGTKNVEEEKGGQPRP